MFYQFGTVEFRTSNGREIFVIPEEDEEPDENMATCKKKIILVDIDVFADPKIKLKKPNRKKRGLAQNYEKFETIKESGKRNNTDLNSPEKINVPRPVFQTVKKPLMHNFKAEEQELTPAHQELVEFVQDSWNMIVAENPYDASVLTNGRDKHLPKADSNNNNSVSSTPNGVSSSVAMNGHASAMNGHASAMNGHAMPINGHAVPINGHASAMNGHVVNGHDASSPQQLQSQSLNAGQPVPRVVYYHEAASPLIKDFKPFDLEAWWGRRIFNNITKSL